MGKSAINPAVVGKHSTDIAALKNDLGIVEDGDTATHTIAQGQYVIWQGALYTADAAIASGTTLAASGGNKNLTAVENGGLNALNDKINSVRYALSDVTSNLVSNASGDVIKTGNVVSIYIHGDALAIAQVIGRLNSEFRPKHGYVILSVYNSGAPYKLAEGSLWISTNGDIEKFGTSGNYAYGTFIVGG